MEMIINVLDDAIWRSYFLLKAFRSGFQIIKQHTDKVKYDKINFPVKLNDIPRNANTNDDIRFNVYSVTKYQTIYPLYSSNKIVI